MKYTILQLKLPPQYTETELYSAAAERLQLTSSDLFNLKITRRAIDARERYKGDIYYILNIEVETSKLLTTSALWQVELSKDEPQDQPVIPLPRTDGTRPVVIGAGPAGLFAALLLAENGYKPLIFERGKKVKDRRHDVGLFWGQGKLNPQSNVLFGEGGAGTFSDGKITSRSKDRRRTNIVRQTFYTAGAAKEVLYDAMFHIGSDKLALIIPAIRERITDLGGEFCFNSLLNGISVVAGRLQGVVINDREIAAETCFLATGHSAYDTYALLSKAGAELQAKPFAVGVRVELPQTAINKSQYGNCSFLQELGAAPFALTLGKNCYTFCMCPGGTIIPCSTEHGSLFSNGMSLSSRSGKLGNAAFLLPQSFQSFSEGYNVIQRLENAAYTATGSDFSLPVTTLKDFPFACKELPDSRSWKRAKAADFTNILSEQMCTDLSSYIPRMLQKMKNIDLSSVVIAGPETRTSAPVRILRTVEMECTAIKGLYPIGEGAGYAGGIMSSAIDGIKAVELSMS